MQARNGNIYGIPETKALFVRGGGVSIEGIHTEACQRDRFTYQACDKTMEHVERYLVPHLVKCTRDACLPENYELNCTRCLTSGQHSLCEVVLER